MGSVWCKADKAQQSRTFSPKSPFNATTITKWTNQVCQVYKRPKDAHRPPRHPQRPSSRSGERPSISHPHPITEEVNNKGWQSATLVVPDYAPVPPPRKKRKRKLQELERNALSMNHLNRTGMLDHSTISLPDRIESEEFSRSSSTFVVRPILENDDYEVLRKYDRQTDDKENSEISGKPTRDELDSHEVYYEIPNNSYVNNKLSFSNPSALDKLSDISEEYIHSDELQNKHKVASEVSEVNRGSDLNILQHIYNISNVSKLPNTSEEVSDNKAKPKTAWLRNILSTDESNDNFDHRRNSDRLFTGSDQRNSLQSDRLHLMNGEQVAAASDSGGNKTPPTTPTREFKSEQSFSYDREATHSVLLEILNRNSKLNEEKEVIESEKSIFQSNTKTNVIYKSSSTDKLADESFINSFPKSKTLEPTPTKFEPIKSKSKSYILTPPLYRRHTYHSDISSDTYNPFHELRKENHISDKVEEYPKSSKSSSLNQNIGRNPYIVQYKDYIGSTNRSYVSALRDLDFVKIKPIDVSSDKLKDLSQKTSDSGLFIKTVSSDKSNKGVENSYVEKNTSSAVNKTNSLEHHQGSPSSSRRSSITDSLQEFEMSIYDMLKESKRHSDSSDDEVIKKPKPKS